MTESTLRYGVIFDMDGVLVDSYHPHFESWRQLAEENDLRMTEEQFAHQFGRTSREIIRSLWGEHINDETIATLDRRKESLYREIIRKDIPVCDGLLELLSDLAADDATMAVGSSGPPENVDAVLDGLNIRHYFSAVITGMDVARGKPDPQVFLLAAERMGLAPLKCTVIEDAPAGLKAAHNAKMKAIGITTSHPRDRLCEADLIISSLTELNCGRVRGLIFGR
jgi:beta-phosphoglucomutase family hydrolase